MIYGGRWETVGVIGKGAQSEIFEAVDKHTPAAETVALKRIKNPKRLNWFFDETEAIARIDHPNIIKLIEFSAFENTAEKVRHAYLVMPKARGGDLSTRVMRYKGDLDGTLVVAKQIAMALLAAHKAGVIHRDVKPSNILFTGIGDHIWLTDFGVCLLKDHETAPPEQGDPTPRVTEAEDIYALGMIIYYMITGGRSIVPQDAGTDLTEADRFAHLIFSQMIPFVFENMICKPEHRLRTMADVINCIEQLEN